MGLSADSSLVFVKTMDGELFGISTKADSMEIQWRGAVKMNNYDISPYAIEERNGLVFALSDKAEIFAFKRADGSVAWIHKLSNCLVNPLGFVNDHKLIAATSDGKIECLEY